MNPTAPRILDIVNTDHAALNFLAFRVSWINRNTEFQNDIICSPGPHFQRLQVRDAQVSAFEIPRDLSPVSVGGLLVRLVRHLRERRYTIVHTHNSITGAVGRIAARLARVPVTIHTTHGFHFHENMGRMERMPYVLAERWLARCCDLLLCQNREELEDIRRLAIRPRLGVQYVGNGIDLRGFRPRTVAPRNPRPTVLFVGRLEPVKNHAQLFDALELLRARYNPVVWCVGEGPALAMYQAEVQRRGIADMVQFLGYRYDIPELTAAADVVVLPSIKEGIPRAVMQAMAVGVPVVATDVKGTREVVIDGRTGFLVPLHDEQALADRLSALFDSADLRREIGANALEHAREHFDEETVTRRLVDIYRRALIARGVATAAAATIELGGELKQVGQGRA